MDTDVQSLAPPITVDLQEEDKETKVKSNGGKKNMEVGREAMRGMKRKNAGKESDCEQMKKA